MALSPKNRLSPARSVGRVAQSRAIGQTEHLALKASIHKEGAVARIAIVVPSKVAPLATTRNALRRRVSEVVRSLVSHIDNPRDTVIIVRSPNLPPKAGLQEELILLLQKSGMLRQ